MPDLQTKKAYCAKTRSSNYAASLRLEGLEEPADEILSEWDDMCALANKRIYWGTASQEDYALVQMHKYVGELQSKLAAAERDAGRWRMLMWLAENESVILAERSYGGCEELTWGDDNPQEYIDAARDNHPGSKGRDSTEGVG